MQLDVTAMANPGKACDWGEVCGALREPLLCAGLARLIHSFRVITGTVDSKGQVRTVLWRAWRRHCSRWCLRLSLRGDRTDWR